MINTIASLILISLLFASLIVVRYIQIRRKRMMILRAVEGICSLVDNKYQRANEVEKKKMNEVAKYVALIGLGVIAGAVVIYLMKRRR